MSIHIKQEKGGRAICLASLSPMSRYAKARHKKAAKVLGYAVTLDTPDAWHSASVLWGIHLTPEEAACAASAALMATTPGYAQEVAEAALCGAGAPLPTFIDVVEEAGFWADFATQEERAAYAVACFNRFTKPERDEFRAFVGKNL